MQVLSWYREDQREQDIVVEPSEYDFQSQAVQVLSWYREDQREQDIVEEPSEYDFLSQAMQVLSWYREDQREQDIVEEPSEYDFLSQAMQVLSWYREDQREQDIVKEPSEYDFLSQAMQVLSWYKEDQREQDQDQDVLELFAPKDRTGNKTKTDNKTIFFISGSCSYYNPLWGGFIAYGRNVQARQNLWGKVYSQALFFYGRCSKSVCFV